MFLVTRHSGVEAAFAMPRSAGELSAQRASRFHGDVFETRVSGKPVVWIRGREAVAIFHDAAKLQTEDAASWRGSSMLGNHSPHSLDDQADQEHEGFLSLMGSAQCDALMVEMTTQWRLALRRWDYAERVVLFDEAQEVLMRGTCAWAGIPLPEGQVARRTRDLSVMIEAFDDKCRLWRGKSARFRAGRWLVDLIRDVRRGALRSAPSSALHVIAHSVDAHGHRLSPQAAAMELFHGLRPSVAVAWHITYAASALQEHLIARTKLANVTRPDAGDYLHRFIREVHRFYPCSSPLRARVRADFTWHDHRFQSGALVLLDVYGTHHDPREWVAPEEFRPDRFNDRADVPYFLIPRLGKSLSVGVHGRGGEVPMLQLALAMQFMNYCLTYEWAPRQAVRFTPRGMPRWPRSGIELRNVRATMALEQPLPPLPGRGADAAGVREVSTKTGRDQRVRQAC